MFCYQLKRAHTLTSSNNAVINKLEGKWDRRGQATVIIFIQDTIIIKKATMSEFETKAGVERKGDSPPPLRPDQWSVSCVWSLTSPAHSGSPPRAMGMLCLPKQKHISCQYINQHVTETGILSFKVILGCGGLGAMAVHDPCPAQFEPDFT